MNLKIKKENAIEAYNNADESGKKLLKGLFPGQLVPISIRERIDNGETLTFDDILADQGIESADFAKSMSSRSETSAAFERAELISKAININPLTDSETWYTPYFYRSGSVFSYARANNWDPASCVGARLCGFRTREDAIYAGKTFQQIYLPLL